MKASKIRLGAACWLLLAPVIAFGQGSLTPPGPPGPTMKTLTQVEPRTLISSVPYVITSSGSYYLTGDLIGTASQNGITISANNVSLDLKGFSVVGCSNGIIASVPGFSGVAIRNGTVRQSVGSGINLGNVANCAVEHVRASGNGGNGISAGAGSLIDLCIASGNAGAGITADTGSTVFSCVVQSNSADGIAVSSHCRVNENTCDANGSGAAYAGIHVTGSGGRFEANNVSANNSSGIKVDGTNNLVIKNSACANTSTDYNIASGNSYGQILAGPGAGFTNSNPWANISCAAPIPTCAVDSDCATNQFCSGGTCVPKEAAGLACTGNNQCLSGICQSGVCQSNAPTCSDGIKNGAETDIDCGGGTCPKCALGKGCTLASDCASGICNAGLCVASSCSDGIKDGAETDIDCGGGTCSKCTTGKACSVGSDCVSGSCCGGVCHDLTSDPNNCGGCGVVCSANNLTPTCSGSICSGVCNSGFADCDGNKQSNGCEVNLNTSLANCGGCGATCSANNMATTSCSAGNCSGTCNVGFADCNLNLRTDGCETSIATDPNNCGGCGVTCSSNHMATRTCSSGSCSGTCAAGFADCNNNKQSDGCEINLTNDKNNCGSCGHVCTGTLNCVSSVCQ